MSTLKKTIIKGTIWSVLGQMASLVIILITNIWLARLLSPNEFGQVGVIMFFITLANVFTESGLGGALVRKKDATKIDYSTVFVTNLVFSLFCFILIYFNAEYIANYYNDILIKNLLIVSSLVLIINSFQLTQNVKLVSEMKFKQKSVYRFISVFISSIIGIYFAYQGLGVWALVLIQLLTASINTLLLWVFEDFFLKFDFSKHSFKELYAFGINTTLTSLLITGFDNIYQLVLAKYFSVSQTGYFYQAKKLQEVPGGILNMVAHSVIYSSLSKLQDDKPAFTKAYNKITLYFIVVLGFISSCIYTYTEAIVILLYGNEWSGIIFYMQLLTIASFFYLQEMINQVIFKVFNQTRQILHLEYFKKIVQIISIAIGVYYLNLEVLIVGFVITNIIGYFINYYYSRKIIGSFNGYELFILLKIMIVSAFSVLITLSLCKVMNLTGTELLFTLPILFFIYIGGNYMFKIINIKKEIKNIINLYES